jgi:hypothetical protein
VQLEQRAPGLQIVIVESNGSQRVAYQPPPMVPMLDVTPAPEVEPATRPDAEAERFSAAASAWRPDRIPKFAKRVVSETCIWQVSDAIAVAQP